jgi:hypothetical protein
MAELHAVLSDERRRVPVQLRVARLSSDERVRRL